MSRWQKFWYHADRASATIWTIMALFASYSGDYPRAAFDMGWAVFMTLCAVCVQLDARRPA